MERWNNSIFNFHSWFEQDSETFHHHVTYDCSLVQLFNGNCWVPGKLRSWVMVSRTMSCLRFFLAEEQAPLLTCRPLKPCISYSMIEAEQRPKVGGSQVWLLLCSVFPSLPQGSGELEGVTTLKKWTFYLPLGLCFLGLAVALWTVLSCIH